MIIKDIDRIVGLFNDVISSYHILDDVNQPYKNPFLEGSLESLFFHKNWIDTVQWHQEDLIRNPQIDPIEALKIKRKIDALNQERTDVVELLDSYIFQQFESIIPEYDATLNTESPAWAFDRLSILCLKIYHMKIEAMRKDADLAHVANCQRKLDILNEQLQDLSLAISQLLDDYGNGVKKMKVYRQMKMYNDPSLNPILYNQK